MQLYNLDDGRWPTWPWFAVGALAVTDCIWIIATPVQLSAASVFVIAGTTLTAAFLVFAADRSRQREQLYVLGMGLAFALVAWPALRIFNHLTMTLSFPWADSMLSSADNRLGLDWIGYIGWLNDNPRLFGAIEWTYAALDLYAAVFFVGLSFCRMRRKRCFEFIALFVVCACMCMAIGGFFPAKAAMIHYSPDLTQFQNIRPTMGTYHIENLTALRASSAPVLSIGDLPGLVTFPSFHTAMGLLIIYACRGNPLLFGISLMTNIAMITTTPLLGSHYFVDLIGGGVAAMITITIIRVLPRNIGLSDREPPMANIYNPAAMLV